MNQPQRSQSMNTKDIWHHYEKIRCPQCGSVELATVRQTVPFWSYAHECQRCQYLIGESEWEKVDE